jgi:hypothetical protein
MNTQIRAVVFGMALLVGSACSSPGRDAAGTAGRDTTTRFDHAVAAARAVQGNPAAADSILAAHGFTRAGFDSLMYEIAADSQQARVYTEAIR